MEDFFPAADRSGGKFSREEGGLDGVLLAAWLRATSNDDGMIIIGIGIV